MTRDNTLLSSWEVYYLQSTALDSYLERWDGTQRLGQQHTTVGFCHLNEMLEVADEVNIWLQGSAERRRMGYCLQAKKEETSVLSGNETRQGGDEKLL